MISLAQALPRTRIARLNCGQNPWIEEAGWAALAEALPQLACLSNLNCYGNAGMGCGGAGARSAAGERPRACEFQGLRDRG